jgi:ABC-type nitrate/sulfonate/bicarbonate transport system permease component
MAALTGLWELAVRLSWVDAYTLPAPTRVLRVLVQELPGLRSHIWITLQEAGIGFAAAIILAILLALMMDFVPLVKKGLYPILVLSQTVPIIVLAPLFGMWFGFGILPKIVIVVLVCFFPIIVSLLDGIEAVDADALHLIEGMGANQFQRFRWVKFPGALVSLFSGIRIAATYSIMGAVIGEWLGGTGGLGVYMLRVRHSFALDKMFAAILIVVLLSIAVFKGIDLLQKWLMPWAREV